MYTTDIPFALLDSIKPLSTDLRNYFDSNIEFQSLKKKEHLIKIGQTCRKMTFVIKGLFRSYGINEQGEEANIWFMKEDDVIISTESYYEQIPSTQGIQALEDSVVCTISYDRLENHIYNEYPEFNYHGRVLNVKYNRHYCKEKDMLLLNKSARERYQCLVNVFPEVYDRLPHVYLASYLRISESELSRIRL